MSSSGNQHPDLFDAVHESATVRSAPLAHRMRPTRLDDFVGQERVLGPGKPLRTWIESDRVPSLILWGPPGCGKTTLSQVIASKTSCRFVNLSAVLSGVKDIKEAVENAKHGLRMTGRKTILFVDEIHRFNKSQQDALLPHVEDGTVTLIGATTENPSFELNSALLSRARVIRLERMGPPDLAQVIRRALTDPERGLADVMKLSDEAIDWLSHTCEGDARRALTALETISLSVHRQGTESEPLTLDEVKKSLESALERQPIPYDKSGEEHYNVVSAFIKSIRDSDPQAGLYYLARMLEGGEDPIFICRRLVILAAEDIGNADPRALQIAVAAKDALEFIGLPEGRIPLGQAVTYLALAPKSNAAYKGINAAISEVHATGALPVPMHLRNAVSKVMKDEGYAKGYRYPHAEAGGENRVRVSNLPKEIQDRKFYEPTENGLEKQLKEKLDRLQGA